MSTAKYGNQLYTWETFYQSRIKRIFNSFGSSENANQFTGKEIDPESGLTYFGARYYNPIIGRWISKDKIAGSILGPQGMNRYTYCLNNPLIYVDLIKIL